MTQLDSVQAAVAQVAEELGPEVLGLAVTGRAAQHFPSAISADAGRDHDGLADDPTGQAHLAVRRIQEHVGEREVVEGAGAPERDLGVELRADPADLALADPGAPHRDHQVVDPAGAHPFDVGLHDDRVQRHVDPPAGVEQRGEERPGPDLRDPHRQVPGRRGDGLVAGAVALGRAGLASLVHAGADVRGRLRVDELLHDRAEQLAHELASIGAAHHLEQLKQGRLVQGHRVDPLSVSNFGRLLTEPHAVAPQRP